MTDIEIFLQRNMDRMDRDTLIGVMADKFNLSLEQAEEIIMEREKIRKKESLITVTRSFLIETNNIVFALEKGDKINILHRVE